MSANAALFFFGSVQHTGVAVGPFHEPVLPAIVEAVLGFVYCGVRLRFFVVQERDGA